MKVLVPDSIRRLRLRAMMAQHLVNWREVWSAHDVQALPPPLRFRTGATLHHTPGDAPVFLFFEIFANGCYRRRRPLPVAGRVVDIGANIGAFILDCAFRRPALTFHAYEPNPDSFQTLERNIDANGLRDRVTVFNEAVTGRGGTIALWRGGGSLAAGAFAANTRGETHTIQVPGVPLSTVIDRAGHTTLLKIDAEGAEADVLESADSRTLERIQVMVGEYHERLVPGVMRRVGAALATAGFSTDSSGGWRRESLFVSRRR
ncbi:MAG: FkbM family methyltransferase [Acidobacteria bacterium]|nr:FkbM family methyltransferase [Acidobacteriota bacterium]